MAIRWVLDATLARFKQSGKALAHASGVPLRTVRRIERHQAKRLNLAVADRLLVGLECITNTPVTYNDLLA